MRDYAEEGGSETSKIHFHSSEGIELRSDESFIKMTAQENIEIRSMSSNVKLSSNESIDFKAAGDGINIEGSAVNIKGDDVNVEADGTLNLKGKSLNASGDEMSLYADNPIQQSDTDPGGSPAGGARGADMAEAAEEIGEIEFDEIKAKMIVPLHESTPYIRDEDEEKCKTPRNKKYQG